MTTLAMVARLGGVFALLAVVLWVLKRTGGVGARRRGVPLQVLSTTRLGKTATLSVVRVHDEEYVLGVTGSAVTVVSSRPAPDAPAAAPAPVPAPAPLAAADSPLEDLLVETPPRPAGPPSTARFLRDGWEVLRKRPVEATAVSTAAVAAALAHARGEDSPPAPRAPYAVPSDDRSDAPTPSSADGPADDQAGTDAGPGGGYDLWSRSDVAV